MPRHVIYGALQRIQTTRFLPQRDYRLCIKRGPFIQSALVPLVNSFVEIMHGSPFSARCILVFSGITNFKAISLARELWSNLALNNLPWDYVRHHGDVWAGDEKRISSERSIGNQIAPRLLATGLMSNDWLDRELSEAILSLKGCASLISGCKEWNVSTIESCPKNQVVA